MGLWAGAPAPSAQGTRGPPVPAGLRPDSRGCARLGPFGALFARFASALAPGPLPLRASASGRRARPPFGARSGACARPRFARLPGPALGPSPPAPPLGPCAPLRGSVGSRWPPCARVALAALRPPFWSALLRLGLPLALRGFPAGAPPWPARFAASGPGASAPGGLRGPSGRLFWPPAPRGFLCSPRPRGCAGISVPGCQVQASGPLRGPDLTARPGYAVG